MFRKLPVVATLVKCDKCKREILVERVLIGTNHTATTIATCWDCLSDKEKQEVEKTYPNLER